MNRIRRRSRCARTALPRADRAPTALVRTGTSTFHGVTMVCTHQGSTIDVIGGTSFRCPNHGASFNSAGVNTGGQQTSSLATFTATFDGVNTVTIPRS